MSDELERGPFGQRLSLLVHRLPRATPSPLDWELERGFHLQILSESLFALSLRPREATTATTLPLLEPEAAGVSRLLIWHRGPEDEEWEAFASHLRSEVEWQGALILSHSDERGQAWTRLGRRRVHSQGALCPVVQVFQDAPPVTFFSVEKNLFVLGRVARRLDRYARLRRLLPW